MTNTQRIHGVLRRAPWLTATEVAHRLKESPATISSLMYRMWKKYKLYRVPRVGPRGGNVYCIVSDVHNG